jgi:mono/diheme cytochrome c family protein
MRFIATFIISIVIITVAVAGFAYSGWYDVSATSPHGGAVAWLLSTTSHASARARASTIRVPELSGEGRLLAGASDFDAMCAGCHGAPGVERGAVGQGLNPPAPGLDESAEHLTAAELFWVTKHGIRMTGMPAWGVTHDDEALWSVVAFVTALPEMDANRYQDLLARAKDQRMGHHAPGRLDQQRSTDDRPGKPTSEEDSHDHADHPH